MKKALCICIIITIFFAIFVMVEEHLYGILKNMPYTFRQQIEYEIGDYTIVVPLHKYCFIESYPFKDIM